MHDICRHGRDVSYYGIQSICLSKCDSVTLNVKNQTMFALCRVVLLRHALLSGIVDPHMLDRPYDVHFVLKEQNLGAIGITAAGFLQPFDVIYSRIR